MTADPTEEQDQEDTTAEKPTPAVAEDPRLVEARLDLELAKIGREKERLGLLDQSERAKLIKDTMPDFSGVTVEKDTTSTSDTPSALAECLIQQTVFHVVDDIADDIMQAVNALPVTADSPPTTCFFVTTDGNHREDVAAHRDVEARLTRLQASLDRLCPEETRVKDSMQPRLAADPVSASFALLSAVPGAITMATRLFAHQYTTSSYTSSSHAGVDLHTAGALVSRTSSVPGTNVFVRRLQVAPDPDLQTRLLEFALDLDERLHHHRVQAHKDAALARASVERLKERRTQVATRTNDLFGAWKDKVGKSAGATGLQEDLALVKALDEAIGAGQPDSPGVKRLTAVREVVKKRIAAVLDEVSRGSGEIGAPQLLAMVESLDREDRGLADLIVSAQQAKAAGDQRVAELEELQRAGLEFIESLGASDSSGERLFDKASNGALLVTVGTLVVYVRLLHAGADGVDVTKFGPDHRNTMHGASIEWALLRDGTALDAGVRTQIGYQRVDLSKPEKSRSGLVAGASKPRVDLAASRVARSG